jgi:phospholipase C
MTESRRDFLKKAALLAGGTGLWSSLPLSVQKAMAISPDPGTTFYDAEHVVMLMQENRSFDHCFGTLQGVRGFNDPRAIRLPNGHKVWLQSGKDGKTFAPFRLNMKDTSATWMGGVPHSWEDQIDAFNQGKNDGWIDAKRPGNKDYKHIPLTMGYYQREDIPFYYAFADAFTVCDQHFCAALTGTTTNRSYFWTGKTYGKKGEKALVRNGEMGYEKEADWLTFPERLEKAGISWKVYQNELSIETVLEGEDKSLLANFTNNNLEWFKQYGVRYSPGHYEYLVKREQELPLELVAWEKQRSSATGEEREKAQQEYEKRSREWTKVTEELKIWTPERFEQLSAFEKALHQKGMHTHINDPKYHQTEILNYLDGGEERSVKVPAGDILYDFRKDVDSGNLPKVTWLVAPQRFSDHPSAPWYGAWYVSEVLDILTKNPEVWKKTIFILNYDENDGYFDHIAPFVPPNPRDQSEGKVSPGLGVEGEYVTLEEEIKAGFAPERSRQGPVGLGFRVPLVVASPWSRGGWVNSEVCDITSTIMFLEKFLTKKTGKKIVEDNISSWRRAISGDLTSVFRPYNGEEIPLPEVVDRDELVKEIYNARFKAIPDNYKELTDGEALEASANPMASPLIPKQEPGTRDSSALNYELYVDSGMDKGGKHISLSFQASDELFGKEAWGSPFNVYAPGRYLNPKTNTFEPVRFWSFAVKAGDKLSYDWPLDHFDKGQYHLQAHGPNGFLREFKGNAQDPQLAIRCEYQLKDKNKGLGQVLVKVKNLHSKPLKISLADQAYKNPAVMKSIGAGKTASLAMDTRSSYGWYDCSLVVEGYPLFNRRFAGRVEFGQHSKSDPLMGGVL